MSTNFPSSLDSFATRTAGQTIGSAHINNLQDAVAALEAKVGVNGSAVTSSLDYKVANISSANPAEYFKQAGVFNNLPRALTSALGSMVSQQALFSGFVAPVTMNVNSVRVYVQTASSGVTAAYASIFSVASNGDLTQLAVSANTTAWGGSTGQASVALSSAASLTAGNAYAVGILWSGGTPPTIFCAPALATTGGGTESPVGNAGVLQPFLITKKTGLTSLAASITFASMSEYHAAQPYVEMSA